MPIATPPRIDPHAIVALDTHVHIEADGHGHHSLDDQLRDASARYRRAGQNRISTIQEVAAHRRRRNLAAVVFSVDARTATGHPQRSSESIAEHATR